MDNINKIYERIESLYLEKGLTRRQFEIELELPQSFLSELKSGRTKTPSAKKLEKISEYFHVRIGYILGDDKGKDFDEFVAESDFRGLSDVIKELDRPMKTLVVNLIDKFFLLIYHDAQDKNKVKLDIYYNLLEDLFYLKINKKFGYNEDVDEKVRYENVKKDLIKGINKLLITPIGDEIIEEIANDEAELVDLYRKLEPIKQAEYRAELKGYIKAKEEK